MSKIIRMSLCAIVATYLLLVATPAKAVLFKGFVLTEIENSRGEFEFFGAPSINNNGIVAVVASLDSGGQRVLQYSAAKMPTTIADTTGQFNNFGSSGVSLNRVQINNNNVLVYNGDTDSGLGVFASNGGLITKIVDDSGALSIGGSPIVRVLDRNFDLNNSGDVIFRALLASGQDGIYQRNVAGGNLSTRIEADGDDFGLGTARINDNGAVAVQVFFVDGNRTIQRHQILSSVVAGNVVMDTNAGFDPGFEDLDINNSSRVVFTGLRNDGVQGIFSVAQPPFTTAVDNTGPFDLVRDVAINNNGKIAFTGILDGGGRGIFVGPNPVTDKVIATGDVIGKKGTTNRVVTGISLSTSFDVNGLNDRGQLVFTVSDQFGDRFVFRASNANPFSNVNIEGIAQLTTGDGTSSKISQPTMPDNFEGLKELMFDYRFLTTGGELIVTLDDIEVGRVAAPNRESNNFTTHSLLVDLLPFSDLPGALQLGFELVGGIGQTVQLDNISFFNLMNPGFETGDFTGWTVTNDNGSFALVTGAFALGIPEPATATLGLIGLAGLMIRRRRIA